MSIALIFSDRDLASMNMFSFFAKELVEQKDAYDIYTSTALNKRMYVVKQEDVVYSEWINEEIEEDTLVFVSEHCSEKQVKSLTVHHLGNFGKPLGGKEGILVTAPARLSATLFRTLQEKNTLAAYEIVYEATHHGPYVDKAVVFIEIGSTKEEWEDKKAGALMHTVIIEGIKRFEANRFTEQATAICFGGMHYAREFSKLVAYNYALGHICSKHSLTDLNENTLKQAIEKTQGANKQVVIDWKSCGPEKARLVALLEELDIKYLKLDKLKKELRAQEQTTE